MVKFIPWVEHNTEINDNLDTNILPGLREFSKITKEAIVSTVPLIDFKALYKRLNDMSRLNVIPGLKASKLIKDINDYCGWRDFAKEIERLINETGTDKCILEFETISKPHTNGDIVLDEILVDKAFSLFPKDIEYLVWPGAQSYIDEKRERQLKILQLLNKNINMKAVGCSLSTHNSLLSRGVISGMLEMGNTLKNKPTTITYFYLFENNTFCWDMTKLYSYIYWSKMYDEVLIYPGASKFKEKSEIIVNALQKYI